MYQSVFFLKESGISFWMNVSMLFDHTLVIN